MIIPPPAPSRPAPLRPMEATTILPPHAPLRRYYGRQPRQAFVRGIFDRTACDYDRVERVMALGSGAWYRRQALLRAGLRTGMRVLDVAVGTGMVAREAATIVRDPRLVLGIDPSSGMLAEATRRVGIPVVRGTGERLPLASGRFDAVTMGYALRHLSDVSVALREFRRVLKPGGIVCLLEMTVPDHPLQRYLLRVYMRAVVPFVTRLTATRAESQLLWRYYWDTIEACVPPARVLDAMRSAGFVDVRRDVQMGIFSEYTGRSSDATA